MKFILVLFSLALFGCSEKLQVGDCVYDTDSGLYGKITRVGKYSAEVVDVNGIHYLLETNLYDNKHIKQDCFGEFSK